MNARIILAFAIAVSATVSRPVDAASPSLRQGSIRMHAHGQFDVKIVPQTPDNEPARISGLMRLSLDKRFHGALDGVSRGEMLATRDATQKNGAYVALESFSGTLEGRTGGFALVHRALLLDGESKEWTVAVVPGSGSGALAGIEGAMRITVVDGRHEYDLDYTLAESDEASKRPSPKK